MLNFVKNIIFIISLSAILVNPAFGRSVVLTFDDGPRPETTKKILSILEQEEVPATFFFVGKMMNRYPELVKEVFHRGFEIGNHTYNHPRLINLKREEISRELNSFNSLLYELIGKETSFFRPPGGRYDKTVLDVARKEGYYMVLWSRHANDTYKNQTKSNIVNRLTESPRSTELLMMHDGPEKTIKALPEIIRFYKDKGFEFKTVSETMPPLFKNMRSASRENFLLGEINFKIEEKPEQSSYGFIGILALFATVSGSVFFIRNKRGKLDKDRIISLVFLGYEKTKMVKILNILNHLDIKGTFFLSSKDLKSLNKKELNKLNKHKIACRNNAKSTNNRADIDDWEKNLGVLKYSTLPLYYSFTGYSRSVLRYLTDKDFIPVKWKFSPLVGEKTDFVVENFQEPGVIPVRVSKIRPAEIVELIKKLYKNNYTVRPLEEYMFRKQGDFYR